jgi:tRNA(Ile)-lysidine synthase
LLRGAGPHGLAAMPAARAAGGPALIRPLLTLPRAALEDYARKHGVAWIDDESNADRGLRRNFLRHEIAPQLGAAFPGYPATLVRAAAHSAEAAQLLDELAALDAGDAAGSGDEAATLDRAALATLAQRSLPRARNVLRWFLRHRGLPPPSTARLATMLLQFVHAAPDARVRVAHAGVELGIFRGRIVVHAPPAAPFVIAWSGEPALALPHGVLAFEAAQGEGLAANVLETMPVTVRRREGGERLRIALDRPSRAVRRLLYDAGIEPWARASLPLVWCGETLAAVPGIGIDAAMRAAADAPGIVVHWHPGRDPACG